MVQERDPLGSIGVHAELETNVVLLRLGQASMSAITQVLKSCVPVDVSNIDQLCQLMSSQGIDDFASICVGCSRDASNRTIFEGLIQFAAKSPIVILDEGFDEHYGMGLVAQGIEDYIDISLPSHRKELRQRLVWSVLRHRVRLLRQMPLLHSAAYENCPDWSELYRIYLGLPPRERQVLDLLAAGLEPKQIARRLAIRWSTVRNHVKNLRDKFHAHSVSQLVNLTVRTLYEVGTGQNDYCRD